jgi:hypothetical protein
MKIALLIPSTTHKRHWTKIEETYLYKSLTSFSEKACKDHEYKVYVAVDVDDNIYSQQNEKNKIYSLCKNLNLNIQFYPLPDNIEKGHVTQMWNFIFDKAVREKNEYFWITGDDINYLNDGWIEECIDGLQKTKNIGAAGIYNGNQRIITQFFVSKRHWEIFGWGYNPEIKNWGCDDHLNHLYAPELLHVFPQYNALNVGGEPRYTIDHSYEKKLKELVEKDRETLKCWLEANGGYCDNQIPKRRRRKGGRSYSSRKTNR